MAVDKFIGDSLQRAKIQFPIKHKGGVGSRSFRQPENRYDSVMRFLVSSLTSVCLSFGLVCVAGSAWAQSEPQEPQRMESQSPLERAPQRNPASLSDSVRRAQRETGGQILGAERVQYDGREINRVKVMDDRGRVRYMDDDPQRRRDSGRPQRDDGQPPRARGDNPRRP